MKNSIVTLACVGLLLSFPATTIAQAVSYKADNKTKKLAPVKLGLTMSFSTGNQIMIGGLVQGNITDKLFYHGEYRKGLVRGFASSGYADKEQLVTSQKELKSGYWEAGAEWAIVDNVKEGEGKFKIVTHSGFGSERFFMATCDKRTLITLGGGIFGLSYNYYLDDDTAHYFMSNGSKLYAPKDKMMHSSVSTTGIFAGVSFRKIKKAAVSSGGYRYRKLKATSWSFQGMTGSSRLQDITVNGVNYAITGTKSSALGYRIMWRAERGPTSTCVEFGKMPHITFDNDNNPGLSLFGPEGISSFANYFRLSFNFILFGNDVKYGLMQKKDK
jgi:hypothetical protein